MEQYLDPKYDLTFKRIFAEHKNLCISLINAILQFEGEKRVVEIEYQSGELVPELPVLKNSIVDVRCTDKSGRQFIVEMQMNWTPEFKSRVLLNGAKAYVSQLDKSQQIKLLNPVYSINLVNDIFEHSPEMNDDYYHHYQIVNIKHTEKQIEGLEFVFIELPKFSPQNRSDRRLLELWLRFLTEINENTTEIPQELLEDADIREAIGYVRESAFSKAEKLAYDQFKIDVITARSVFITADEAREEGIEIGKAAGEAERKALADRIAELEKRLKEKE